MPNTFRAWFQAKIGDRLYALLWGTLASDLEAQSIMDQFDNLEALEERARRLEASDKPHLAELLRKRAARLSPDSPGGMALEAIDDLSADEHPLRITQLDQPLKEKSDRATRHASAKKSVKARNKKRTQDEG